jgi:hypothetical protein
MKERVEGRKFGFQPSNYQDGNKLDQEMAKNNRAAVVNEYSWMTCGASRGTSCRGHRSYPGRYSNQDQFNRINHSSALQLIDVNNSHHYWSMQI